MGDFVPMWTGKPVDPKFQVAGVVTPTIFFCQKTRLNDLWCGIKIWTDLSSVLSQCTRLTDRQTERILIARRRLHSIRVRRAVKTIDQ